MVTQGSWRCASRCLGLHTHTHTHALSRNSSAGLLSETRIGYPHATSWNISMSTHSNTGTAKENPQEGLRSLLPPCTFPHPFPNCLPPTPRSQPPGLCSSNKDAGDVDTISCGALGYISVPGPALDVVRCAAAPNVARHTSRRTLQPYTKSVRNTNIHRTWEYHTWEATKLSLLKKTSKHYRT